MTDAEKLLQKIQGLFFFGGAIAGIFQNIFLFRWGNFRTVVIYDCASLILLFILYLFSGRLLRQFSSRTLMRAGLAVFVILNTLFFLLREQSIHYIVQLGIVAGIGHGLFWPGNNLSQYLLTKSETRHRYFGKLNFWLNLGLGAGPIIGGVIITLFKTFGQELIGYMTLFLLVAAIDFYIFLLAWRLPRHAGIEFSITDMFRHERSRSWKIVLAQQFIYGLWDVAFAAFSGVLIYLIVKQELTVGIVKTSATFVFALASVWAGKLLSQKEDLLLPASILSTVGLVVFAVGQNWWGILLYIFLTNIFQPFINIATSKSYYDIIDQAHFPWPKKYHFLVERDTALGAGRIINYLVLLAFFTQSNQIAIAKTWILIVPVFPLTIGLLQWWQNRFRPALETNV